MKICKDMYRLKQLGIIANLELKKILQILVIVLFILQKFYGIMTTMT